MNQKQLRLAALAVAGALVLVFLVGSYKNSEVLSTVKIKLKPGLTEISDPTVLGIGKDNALPDYRIKLAIQREFLKTDLGIQENTSAKQGLEFPVKGIVPIGNIQEVLVIEADSLEDDVLERFQPTTLSYSGKAYDVELVTVHSFDAGMEWFFKTPVGKIIFWAGVIFVVIFLFALFGSLLK